MVQKVLTRGLNITMIPLRRLYGLPYYVVDK